jgi:hypothetical protein
LCEFMFEIRIFKKQKKVKKILKFPHTTKRRKCIPKIKTHKNS